MAHSGATTPPGRRVLFTFIALLIPILFFFAAELLLRAFHFGGEYDLVFVRELAGKKYYVLNRQVARRYFSGMDVAIPDARDAVFAVEKSPNTLRIFCLGGSTTAGFPYTFNATFPSLLQDRLETLFPDRNIEVVNVGISAINSFSVLDFVHELVHYEPDAFLIYMGHNEFYGALGVASSQSFGKSRGLKLLFLRLEKLKLFQLVRGVVDQVRSVGRARGSKPDVTLMEVMARDKSIRLDNPDYERAVSYFRANLRDIIEIAQKHGVAVLVSTLVSNLQDQPPFVSLESEVLTKSAHQRLLNGLAEAESLQASGDPRAALAMARQACGIDPGYAAAYFRLAQAWLGMGESDSARVAFVRARDLDGLRFRASSDFNRIIKKVCSEQEVAVVDMDSAFAANSPHGIVGHELLLEHLHPNFDGYFLMAKVFVHGLAQYSLLVPRRQWSLRRQLSDSAYRELAGVTPLDKEIAALRTERLTSHWPFSGRTTFQGPEVEAFVKQAAQDVYRKKRSWNQAHYDVALVQIRQGRYREAECEYEAVIKVVPTNFYPYLKLADLKLAQGEAEKAKELYERALTLSRRLPFAYAKLGTVFLMQQKPHEALPLLRRALELNSSSERLKSDDLGRLHYALAVALAQTGDRAEAVRQAQLAKQILPDDPVVLRLLSQLGLR